MITVNQITLALHEAVVAEVGSTMLSPEEAAIVIQAHRIHIRTYEYEQDMVVCKSIEESNKK